MSPEFLNTFASTGTFVVIGVTAIVAFIQLRHLRSANQVAAVQTFFMTYEGAELREAFGFVRNQLSQHLEDPVFRHELRSGQFDRSHHPEIQVCNFFDQWGAYYRNRVIDRSAFMQLNAQLVAQFWEKLELVVSLVADPVNGNTSFQQFEYLTVEARRWLKSHPAGDFPKNTPRIPLLDAWREVDPFIPASPNESNTA
jgi:hypothetical protein